MQYYAPPLDAVTNLSSWGVILSTITTQETHTYSSTEAYHSDGKFSCPHLFKFGAEFATREHIMDVYRARLKHFREQSRYGNVICTCDRNNCLDECMKQTAARTLASQNHTKSKS